LREGGGYDVGLTTQSERRIGYVAVDTAQLVILDPTNLVGDDERERVFNATMERGSGAVWLSDPPGGLPDPPEGETADAIVIDTQTDGTFPVLVTFDESGTPVSIRVDLRGTQ
jgi:hypothetical protein